MRTLHSSATSVLIKEGLKSVEAVEGGTATLQCQLSREAPVEWRKGHALLRPSTKYRMRQEGTVAELLIRHLEPGDAGDYTCVVGSQKSTAALSVNGKASQMTCETLECFCLSLPLLLSVHSLTHLSPHCASTCFTLPLVMLPHHSSPQSPSTLGFCCAHSCVCVVLSSHLFSRVLTCMVCFLN